MSSTNLFRLMIVTAIIAILLAIFTNNSILWGMVSIACVLIAFVSKSSKDSFDKNHYEQESARITRQLNEELKTIAGLELSIKEIKQLLTTEKEKYLRAESLLKELEITNLELKNKVNEEVEKRLQAEGNLKAIEQKLQQLEGKIKKEEEVSMCLRKRINDIMTEPEYAQLMERKNLEKRKRKEEEQEALRKQQEKEKETEQKRQEEIARNRLEKRKAFASTEIRRPPSPNVVIGPDGRVHTINNVTDIVNL